MAEVYVSGQIESGSGFGDNRIACYWTLQLGGGWRLIEGLSEGQSQTDLPGPLEEAYFSHPIDLHLGTKTIQGWPRIHLQVWHHDTYGRQELYGYGSLFIPTSPGEHELECHIWRPRGGVREEMMQTFVGGGLQVVHPSLVEDPEERRKINSVAMGIIKLRLNIITRHFDRFGIVS